MFFYHLILDLMHIEPKNKSGLVSSSLLRIYNLIPYNGRSLTDHVKRPQLPGLLNLLVNIGHGSPPKRAQDRRRVKDVIILYVHAME